MKPELIKKWLLPEEQEIVNMVRVSLNGDDLIAFAEKLASARADLAKCRAMMKEHEWDGPHLSMDDPVSFSCLECGEYKSDGHALLCKWDAAQKKEGE